MTKLPAIVMVRMPEEWKVKLQEIADRECLPVSAVVRQCIKMFLATLEPPPEEEPPPPPQQRAAITVKRPPEGG